MRVIFNESVVEQAVSGSYFGHHRKFRLASQAGRAA